ncbi:MAG: PhzF family phenazine biosynthesis protein [Desulfohalobiaceae bacterium]|nr:PhzF family phenazine biosynthesis protein [Desulfohalobiaceae bacterium]
MMTQTSPKRPSKQVDVFTHQPAYGNPVAVVLEAEDLYEACMQRLPTGPTFRRRSSSFRTTGPGFSPRPANWKLNWVGGGDGLRGHGRDLGPDCLTMRFDKSPARWPGFCQTC